MGARGQVDVRMHRLYNSEELLMSTATESSETPGTGTFVRARVASFLAIAPLGVWTVVHLWNNLSAFQGADAWEKSVTEYPHPIAQLFTGIVVLVPLMLHTLWGIGRLASSRPNFPRYGYWENFKYVLQRITAIGVMLFLGAHIFLAMLKPRLTMGHAERFVDIAQQMHHHKPTLVVYLLGTLGVAYHLANGITTFAMGWGLVSSKAAMRKLEWVNILLILVFWGMSWAAIYALWAAGA